MIDTAAQVLQFHLMRCGPELGFLCMAGLVLHSRGLHVFAIIVEQCFLCFLSRAPEDRRRDDDCYAESQMSDPNGNKRITILVHMSRAMLTM